VKNLDKSRRASILIMNPKEKGNREERKQAKQLSLWMFNDPDVLKRHSTSGADKSVYVGDIVPIKQLSLFNWKKFKFMIEVKSGYRSHIPNFWSYEKVADWYRKARIESRDTDQNILFLICQFKNKQALLITNQCLEKIMFNVCIPVNMKNGEVEYAFVYTLNDVLKWNFQDLFENIDYKGA